MSESATSDPTPDVTTTSAPPTSLDHILRVILALQPNSPLQKALNEYPVNDFFDFLSLDEDDVDALSYMDDTGQTQKLQHSVKKDINLLIEWFGQLSDDDGNINVFANTRQHFRDYKARRNRHRRSSMLIHGQPTPPLPAQPPVVNVQPPAAPERPPAQAFQYGIKVDLKDYPKFDSQVHNWMVFKRKLLAVAATHQMERLFEELDNDEFIYPQRNTEQGDLFHTQNCFLYSVLANNVTGSRGVYMVRRHEDTRDGRAVFLALRSCYESVANKQLAAAKCMTRLSDLKMTHTYNGGALKFLADFQNVLTDYHHATGSDMDDGLKKHYLMEAIAPDRDYAALRSLLLTDPSIDFYACVDRLEQLATASVPSRPRNNRTANANKTQRANKGKSNNNGKRNGSKYGSTYVPKAEFDKMTKEQKQALYDRRKSSLSNNSSSSSSTSATPSASTPATSPPVSDSSVPPNSSTPNMGSILRSSTTAPASGNSVSYVNVTHTRRRVQAQRTEMAGICLLDGGADTSLCGSEFLVEEATSRQVDVYGYHDEILHENIPVGSAITLATLDNGQHVLLRVNEALIIPDCKSLLSTHQVRDFGHQVDDRAPRHGGSCSIHTSDGFCLPFRYHHATIIL